MEREVVFPLSDESARGFKSAIEEIVNKFPGWKIIKIRCDNAYNGKDGMYGVIVVEK